MSPSSLASLPCSRHYRRLRGCNRNSRRPSRPSARLDAPFGSQSAAGQSDAARRTQEYWSETWARPPDWPQKSFPKFGAEGGRSESTEPMSSLRAMHQRQVIVSERIQSHQARAILGVSLRSVQNLAAGGVLPSAAKYARDWTFDEKALRGYVAEREQATRDKARVRINAAPSNKKSVDRAPSHGSQAAYEQALGLKPGQPRRKRRHQTQPTATKPIKDNN